MGALALAALAAASAQAQQGPSLGGGAQVQSYTFGDGLGVERATLYLLPMAYRHPFGDRLSLDLYGAYARGEVALGGQGADTTYTLSGVVDTKIRANWTAAPWAVFSLALNLPTGNSGHSTEEAVVASILANDLLGFREANWGVGFGLTSGVATAYRVGEWGVGVGASYRLADEFEPRSDTSLSYSPGDEVRLRLALDRIVAGNKLTAGVSFQRFSTDQLDRRDLFQAGNRWRGDVTYSFRTGRAATWTAYLSDVWRERGDLTLDVVDQGGAIVGDTLVRTGHQNLLIAGLAGAINVSPALGLRPAADLRVQTRSEGGGTGWLAGVGADFPYRLRPDLSVVPQLRLQGGELDAATPEGGTTVHGLFGAELGVTLRWTH